MTLRTQDLIFPRASTQITAYLGDLDRSRNSITNHLRSIEQDSEFVCAVADSYNLPLIANERCGSWYVPADRKAGSAYFKSTDGHFGQWSFSTRRLNLHILDIIRASDGCIVVDSTKRGKSMPDALSKTVPIWCIVVNRVLFPLHNESHRLRTPSRVISLSEHSQIEARIDGFTKSFLDLRLEIDSIRSRILKPLYPIWVTQKDSLSSNLLCSPDYHPVVLCTSSSSYSVQADDAYVQGAGDDSETWAHGLTPNMFWKHRLAVLSTSEEELPSFIAALISQPSRNPEFVHGILPILPTEQVYIFHGSPDATLTQDHGFGAVISCELCPTASLADRFKARYLNLTCRTGKLGSRDLRIELHKLAPFLTSLNELGLVKLMISCDTGLDLAAGVALAVLCLCASENGTISFHDKPPSIDKDLIRRRLGSIVVSQPEANPSRTTIQAVKDFLMSAKYIQADAKIGEVKQFPAQATVTSIGNAR